MSHDRNGVELQPGDAVIVRCRVRSVDVGQDYCNVSVETLEPMFPGKSKTGISLNSRQVEFTSRVEKPERVAE